MGDGVILFMDADPNKAALMCQRMTPEDRDKTIWASTAEDAIGVLRDYSIRLERVYLDHDMGQEPAHPASPDCGMEVVRWLEKRDASQYHCEFIIHAWNLQAAYKMTKRLKAQGYKSSSTPFGM